MDTNSAREIHQLKGEYAIGIGRDVQGLGRRALGVGMTRERDGIHSGGHKRVDRDGACVIAIADRERNGVAREVHLKKRERD